MAMLPKLRRHWKGFHEILQGHRSEAHGTAKVRAAMRADELPAAGGLDGQAAGAAEDGENAKLA